MLVITAFQRSGTTAFGEAIGRSAEAAYFGEIFHPEGVGDTERSRALRLHPEANYFNFANRRAPIAQPATDAALARCWRDYVRHIEGIAQGRRPVLDIKYNSWFNLGSTWQAPNHAPWLMRMLSADKNVVILHCVRGNLLRQALSEAIAAKTGRYHRPRSTRTGTRRITVDPALLLQRMRDSRQQTGIVKGWLDGVRHASFVYEAMFDAVGGLSAPCRTMLQEVIPSIPAMDDRPELLRAVGDHAARVMNMDEVLTWLKRSEFAGEIDGWMA